MPTRRTTSLNTAAPADGYHFYRLVDQCGHVLNTVKFAQREEQYSYPPEQANAMRRDEIERKKQAWENRYFIGRTPETTLKIVEI